MHYLKTTGICSFCIYIFETWISSLENYPCPMSFLLLGLSLGSSVGIALVPLNMTEGGDGTGERMKREGVPKGGV